MIRYALKCPAGHGFESWFQSADAFDALVARGLVGCPQCGATEIAKTLMAPSLRTTRKTVERAVDAPVADPLAGPLSSPASAREQALTAMRREIEANSEYVGMSFVTEARRIHAGTAPERAIYGEARPDEARKLIEDGVPVAPLPFLPARKIN
ncbi:MAG: DUF1178 family protein [Pseudorhodobacter sp.]|nr:DUF1178 family protein [Pseudorhodobacter sp.]